MEEMNWRRFPGQRTRSMEAVSSPKKNFYLTIASLHLTIHLTFLRMTKYKLALACYKVRMAKIIFLEYF